MTSHYAPLKNDLFLALISSLILTPLHATEPSAYQTEAKDEDKIVHMVIGDQRSMQGPFDSQVALSRQGIVNVRWVGTERIRITALKKGVVIINPTPATARQQRWVIHVKTAYQAHKDKKQRLQLPTKQHQHASLAHTIKSYPWLQNMITPKKTSPQSRPSPSPSPQSSPSSHLLLQCLHPHAQKAQTILLKHHPHTVLSCEHQLYTLKVTAQANTQGEKHLKAPSQLLQGKIQDDSHNNRLQYHESWTVMVTPTLNMPPYTLRSKTLSVKIEKLSFHKRPSHHLGTISFTFHIEMDHTSTQGHIHKPYDLSDTILISELQRHHKHNRMTWNQYLTSVPILRLLLTSSKTTEDVTSWQIMTALSPVPHHANTE